ncbi:hypothetical protein GCM10009850_019920 [Nonomuraea monospora]|uniref:Uncharacterized protein n=1 Tax=Nonomuraea monospora TaxID=568818 RepID=A0ABN3CB51_9ACTN
MLALLWWTWEAYTWLGNQARADEGALRGGTAAATAAVFVVALAIGRRRSVAPPDPVVLGVAAGRGAVPGGGGVAGRVGADGVVRRGAAG